MSWRVLGLVSLVVILVFSPLFSLVSAGCSPYEVYSIDSVFKVDGWLLVEVSHLSYTCVMIVGEWTPVLVGVPDEYYLLTGGNKIILLGGTDPSRETFVGFVNETLYVLTVINSRVPYQNVTITIESEPHNFTLLKTPYITYKGAIFVNGSWYINITAYPEDAPPDECVKAVYYFNPARFCAEKTNLTWIGLPHGKPLDEIDGWQIKLQSSSFEKWGYARLFGKRPK
ncbi:hypothetical protein [Thermococcus sp.]